MTEIKDLQTLMEERSKIWGVRQSWAGTWEQWSFLCFDQKKQSVTEAVVKLEEARVYDKDRHLVRVIYERRLLFYDSFNL